MADTAPKIEIVRVSWLFYGNFSDCNRSGYPAQGPRRARRSRCSHLQNPRRVAYNRERTAMDAHEEVRLPSFPEDIVTLTVPTIVSSPKVEFCGYRCVPALVSFVPPFPPRSRRYVPSASPSRLSFCSSLFTDTYSVRAWSLARFAFVRKGACFNCLPTERPFHLLCLDDLHTPACAPLPRLILYAFHSSPGANVSLLPP